MLAISISWAAAGLVFISVVDGPGTFAAWMIWGGGVCFLGWLLVGIPLVAAGDRIFRLHPATLALGAGFCGVVLMGLPNLTAILTHNFGQGGRMELAPGPPFLKFEASAFLIAASAALLYRGLLVKSHGVT
jgi:hypothetical protein